MKSLLSQQTRGIIHALRFHISISASAQDLFYPLSDAADFLSALCVRICYNFSLGYDELAIFALRAARPSHPVSSILPDF
jgi:hypothetical protein